MMNALKKILGMGSGSDIAALVQGGARIIDVRTKQEYLGGHVRGSMNIPLDQLDQNLNKLGAKSDPLVLCCATGARSGHAKAFLERHGFTNVHNAGSWQSVKNKLSDR